MSCKSVQETWTGSEWVREYFFWLLCASFCTSLSLYWHRFKVGCHHGCVIVLFSIWTLVWFMFTSLVLMWFPLCVCFCPVPRHAKASSTTSLIGRARRETYRVAISEMWEFQRPSFQNDQGLTVKWINEQSKWTSHRVGLSWQPMFQEAPWMLPSSLRKRCRYIWHVWHLAHGEDGVWTFGRLD